LTTVVTEIHITRPPDEVFAYMRDYSNQAVWQAPHVTEVVVEPPGPAQLGTIVHKMRKTPMGKQRLNERVVEIDEAARHWAEVTVDGPLRGSRVTWQVEAEPDGSRVRREAQMRAGWPMRLLLPLINRASSKDARAEFMELRRLLESAPTM
jgi:hypothetical protein